MQITKQECGGCGDSTLCVTFEINATSAAFYGVQRETVKVHRCQRCLGRALSAIYSEEYRKCGS